MKLSEVIDQYDSRAALEACCKDAQALYGAPLERVMVQVLYELKRAFLNGAQVGYCDASNEAMNNFGVELGGIFP